MAPLMNSLTHCFTSGCSYKAMNSRSPPIPNYSPSFEVEDFPSFRGIPLSGCVELILQTWKAFPDFLMA